MRLNSLYRFYSYYFGYPQASRPQSVGYAKIIGLFTRIVKEIYMTQDLTIMNKYKQLFPGSRAIEFVQNLQELAQARFSDPLKQLKYHSYQIDVEPQGLTLHTVEKLYIGAEFIWNPLDEEMIFLTFGSCDNMSQELGVFLTLSENLSAQRLPVGRPKLYTYWSIPYISEFTLTRDEIIRAPVDEVLATCARILTSDRRK